VVDPREHQEITATQGLALLAGCAIVIAMVLHFAEAIDGEATAAEIRRTSDVREVTYRVTAPEMTAAEDRAFVAAHGWSPGTWTDRDDASISAGRPTTAARARLREMEAALPVLTERVRQIIARENAQAAQSLEAWARMRWTTR
jgi:hypothetical protein